MKRLVQYSDSDGSEADEGEEKEDEGGRREKGRSGEVPAVKRLKGNEDLSVGAAANPPLPLPDAIASMFGGDALGVADEGSGHQGRLRSFPHERGNWATYIHLPVVFSGSMVDCVQQFHKHLHRMLSLAVRAKTDAEGSRLLESLSSGRRDPQPSDLSSLPPPLELHPSPLGELHVSVSRTVAIRHHWIEPLAHALREGLRDRQRFSISFPALSFYTNDEKTRSFISLEVGHGHEQLCSLVRCVDECFAQYKLPSFYENPSFHVSLFWCLGDVVDMLSLADKETLQDCWDVILGEHDLSGAEKHEVVEIRCKTGNRILTFPLE